MSKMILITGANRGIGLGLTEKYLAAGWNVLAGCRNPSAADDLRTLQEKFDDNLTIEALDVASAQSINALAEKYSAATIDVVINNAGAFGPRNDDATDFLERLEGQLFNNIDYDAWQDTINTNVFGPLRIAQAFQAPLSRSNTKKFIYISSSAGSIAGGLVSPMPVDLFIYPSTKTLGNKAMATLSRVFKKDNITVACLCPGHVQTRLGGPQATMTVADAADGLYNVIDQLTIEQSGSFIRHDGETIGW